MSDVIVYRTITGLIIRWKTPDDLGRRLLYAQQCMFNLTRFIVFRKDPDTHPMLPSNRDRVWVVDLISSAAFEQDGARVALITVSDADLLMLRLMTVEEPT